jgi:hypothetical protein
MDAFESKQHPRRLLSGCLETEGRDFSPNKNEEAPVGQRSI